MGCTNSKLDDLPAVALCRERCTFLDEAIRQRYLLAESHIAYVHSLEQVGSSLRNFISNREFSGGGGGDSPLSPKLSLSSAKKGSGDGGEGGVSIKETTSLAVKGGGSHHSHSNSDGHIQFHSEPEEGESGSGSDSFSGHSSPLHGPLHHLNHHDSFGRMDYGNPDVGYMMMGANQETLGVGYTHMNYMKSQAKPSVVYEQKPVNPEIVQNYHMGESSSSSYYPYSNPYPYPTNNLSSSSQPYYGYPPQSYGGGADAYYGLVPSYGSPASPLPSGPGAGAGPGPSSLTPSPTPPSPPRASAWDILNFFESSDKYYPQYTPSRDSKELREEEGIPDLEDEDFQHGVVKKVHVGEKFMDGSGGGGGGRSGGLAGDEGGHIGIGGGSDAEASLYQREPSVDEKGVEYEVHVMDKVVDEERNEGRSNSDRPGSRDAVGVVREIEGHFARASESGSEIAKMIEVGRLPYQKKHGMKF